MVYLPTWNPKCHIGSLAKKKLLNPIGHVERTVLVRSKTTKHPKKKTTATNNIESYPRKLGYVGYGPFPVTVTFFSNSDHQDYSIFRRESL